MPRILSSRERLLAAIHHQEPDRVPLTFEFPDLYLPPPLQQAKDQFDVADKLVAMGMDACIDIWLPEPVFAPEVEVKAWREETPEGQDNLLCKEYKTPKGTLRQVVRETADWYSVKHRPMIRSTFPPSRDHSYEVELLDDFNIPRGVEQAIKQPEDLEALPYLLQPPVGDALEQWREDAMRAKEIAAEKGLLLRARRTYAGDAAFWFMDVQEMCINLIENRDFIHDFLRIVQAWQMQLVDMVLDVGIDVLVRRGWYEMPSYFPPPIWGELLAPLIKEEAQRVHQAGALECYILMEGATQLIEQLKQAQIDILWGADPVLGGDDPAVLKRELGGQVCFWGGINAEVVLERGSPEQIQQATRDAILTLGQGGGFVLSPVAAVYEDVPWENVEIMIDTWRQCGAYPLDGR